MAEKIRFYWMSGFWKTKKTAVPSLMARHGGGK
jgi:hypothetical protein